MSLSTNTTYRVLVEKLGSSDPNQFIGNEGEVFYDPSVPALKLSDGSTIGGLTIGGGGGTQNYSSTFVGIGSTVIDSGDFTVETYNNIGFTSETRKVVINSIDADGNLIYPPSFSYIKFENDTSTSSLTIVPKVIQDVRMEYRGFSAGINQLYGDDPHVNQLIIHKTDNNVYYYSNGETSYEDFTALELDNSDVVASVVFYTKDFDNTGGGKETSMRVMNDFFRSFVDNVLYANSGIGTIGDVSTNFDNNIGILTSVLPPLYSPFQFYTSTNPNVWPTNSINDGGNDIYDTGNKIVTNLYPLERDYDVSDRIPYNDGIISVGTSYFGGGNYVTKYANSVFAMVSVGSSIKTLGFSGDWGADDRPQPERSQPLYDTTKYTITNFEVIESSGSWNNENYSVTIDFSKQEAITVDSYNNFFTPISRNPRITKGDNEEIANNILIGENAGEFLGGSSDGNILLGRNAGRGTPGAITALSLTSSTTLAGEANNTYSLYPKGGSGRLARIKLERDGSGDISFVGFQGSGSDAFRSIGRGFGYRSGDVLTVDGSSVGGTTGVDDVTLTVGNTTSNDYSNDGNVIIGDGAGKLGRGNNSVFIGKDAGSQSTSDDSIFIGRQTGVFSTGNYNNFFGSAAGLRNTTGFANNFFGHFAGFANTTGCYNNFFGKEAGKGRKGRITSISITSSTTLAGEADTSYSNVSGTGGSGSNATFDVYRDSSGDVYQIDIITEGYDYNVGNTLTIDGANVGGSSGTDNITITVDEVEGSTGNYNNFFGRYAGRSNTTGCYNNFFGNNAGSCNTTGFYNNFFGNNAGSCNTTGCYNNFFGKEAGFANTTGFSNNFLGSYAGRCNTTGCNNNFFGKEAGFANTTGCYNNFFGNNAGRYNTTGNHNTFLGAFSGISTSASNKIILGHGGAYNQLFDAPDTTKDTQFAIGIRTDANPANYWLVGNENFNVGIGTTNPISKLTVQGGDVKVGVNTSHGVILTSPNGTQYRLIVNNSGVLSTTPA